MLGGAPLDNDGSAARPNQKLVDDGKMWPKHSLRPENRINFGGISPLYKRQAFGCTVADKPDVPSVYGGTKSQPTRNNYEKKLDVKKKLKPVNPHCSVSSHTSDHRDKPSFVLPM